MLLVFLTLFLLPLVSRTQASPITTLRLQAEQMFEDGDTNNDGIAQRAEQIAVFNRYDSNGDGRVSRAEYVTYHESVVPGSSALAHFLFNLYDLDNDHMLDAHDYEHFYRLMDLNRSGYVSKAEFIIFWTRVLRRVQPLMPHISIHDLPIVQPGPLARMMFGYSDSNKDDFLQRAELPVAFNVYDSNGDGRVSRVEFVRKEESGTPGASALANFLFDTYDVDNDHMLDAHDYDHLYHLMDSNDNGHVWKDEFIHFFTALLESVRHLIPRKH